MDRRLHDVAWRKRVGFDNIDPRPVVPHFPRLKGPYYSTFRHTIGLDPWVAGDDPRLKGAR